MIFIRMGLLCFKVIGDGEEVDNAGMMVPCRGQVCTNQREDKDGASRQLRKRKKLFGREFLRRKKKKKKSTFFFYHRKRKNVSLSGEHTKKSTHFVDLVGSAQTHVTLLPPRLSYLLFA